jgi:hypothetical protein
MPGIGQAKRERHQQHQRNERAERGRSLHGRISATDLAFVCGRGYGSQ